MEINKSKRLNGQQFYAGDFPKKQIFWHHTAGTTADGAISWWNQTPEKVGTPYVIDRDGTIYEVFDPKSFAFGLGLTNETGWDVNFTIEKGAIQIEIVSAGHLYPDGLGNMVQYPLYPNKAAKNIIKPDEIWDMGETPWHGFKYFQNYTEKQIESLIWLTKKLLIDFNIQLQADITTMFEYNPNVGKKQLPGIWGHSSLRKDKEDVIPHPEFIKQIKLAFPTHVKEAIKTKGK